MKPTIYVVEDDESLQELYEYSLENEFDCRCFYDGASLFAVLNEKLPDLILLDIMLPGDDGFTLLTRLKSSPKTARIPVIVVSAKGEEISKVKGLNMGADDYVAKPFGVLELSARINANLRKNIKTDTENVSYKDIFVDDSKYLITVNEKPIQTTLKEYKLLRMLCENAGKVQLREKIFNEVWGENYMGETRTLDIHIKEIRKKLSETESAVLIQTVRGVGYMAV